MRVEWRCSVIWQFNLCEQSTLRSNLSLTVLLKLSTLSEPEPSLNSAPSFCLCLLIFLNYFSISVDGNNYEIHKTESLPTTEPSILIPVTKGSHYCQSLQYFPRILCTWKGTNMFVSISMRYTLSCTWTSHVSLNNIPCSLLRISHIDIPHTFSRLYSIPSYGCTNLSSKLVLFYEH